MNDQKQKEYKDRIQELIDALLDFKKRELTSKTKITNAEYNGVLGQDIQDTVFWVIKEANLPRFPQYEDISEEEFGKLSIDDEIAALQEVIREQLTTDIPADLPAMLEALHEREKLVQNMKARGITQIQVVDQTWEGRFRKMVANLEVQDITSEILPEVIPTGALSKKKSDELRAEIQKDTKRWEEGITAALREKAKIDEIKAREIAKRYVDYVKPSKAGERISPINIERAKTNTSLPKILVRAVEAGARIAAIPLVLTETTQSGIADEIGGAVAEPDQELSPQAAAKVQAVAKVIVQKNANSKTGVPTKLDFEKVKEAINSNEPVNVPDIVFEEVTTQPKISRVVYEPGETKEAVVPITIVDPSESDKAIRFAHRDEAGFRENVKEVLEARAKNGTDRELSNSEKQEIEAVAFAYTRRVEELKIGAIVPPLEIILPATEINEDIGLNNGMLNASQSTEVIYKATHDPDRLEKEIVIALSNKFKAEKGNEPPPEIEKEIRENARAYVKEVASLKSGDLVPQIIPVQQNEKPSVELIAEVVAAPMVFATATGAKQLIGEAKANPNQLKDRLEKSVIEGIVTEPNRILSDADKNWIARQVELYVITIQGLDETATEIPLLDLNKMEPLLRQTVELKDISDFIPLNERVVSPELLSYAMPIVFIVDKSADPTLLSQAKKDISEKYGNTSADILMPGVSTEILPDQTFEDYTPPPFQSFYIRTVAIAGAEEVAKDDKIAASAMVLYYSTGITPETFRTQFPEVNLTDPKTAQFIQYLKTYHDVHPFIAGQVAGLSETEIEKIIRMVHSPEENWYEGAKAVRPVGGIQAAFIQIGQRFFGKRSATLFDGFIRRGLSKIASKSGEVIIKKAATSILGKILGTIGTAVGVVGGVVGKALSIIGGWILSKAQIGIKTNIGKVLGGAGLLLGFIIGGPIGAIVGGILGAGAAGINWKKVGTTLLQVIGAILVSIFGFVAIPLAITFIGLPIFVALMLFMINSGAYIVPSGSAFFSGPGNGGSIACFVFNSSWSQANQALETDAISAISSQYGSYINKLCIGGTITLYYGGSSGGEGGCTGCDGPDTIRIYDQGLLSAADAKYTTAHESGHMFARRYGSIYQSFVDTVPNPLPCTYTFGTTNPNGEAFAETIALYIMGTISNACMRGQQFSTLYPLNWQFAHDNIFN
jgi:hypothetical protein